MSALPKDPSVDAPELVLEASGRLRALDFAEVWRYRELLYFLVWRDMKLRFKQTVLGVVWVVLRPVLSLLIYTAVFGRLVKIPSEGVPYSVFVLAAMTPWSFFSAALGASSSSLVGSAHLISKVYFPRLVIPLASLLSASVDLAISFLLVLVLLAYHGRIPPASALVTLPLLFALVGVLSLGASLWLGALNVKYRDVGNAVPFFLQIWMYATPVVYPLSLVPARYRPLVALNPLTGVVEGFRAALFGRPWPAMPLAVSAAAGAVLLLSGLFFFRSQERTFADVV